MITANKGEWSELYALGYLLVHGGAFAANEHAQADDSIFYRVLKIVDNPTGNLATSYRIDGEDVVVNKNGVGILRISRDRISPALNSFFNDLVNHSGERAFSLLRGNELLETLSKDKLAAAASQSHDLGLVIEDLETAFPTSLKGFSIKSEIGSPATVFNASHSTNVTFRLKGGLGAQPFENPSNVKTNISYLVHRGYSLEFVSYDNPKLQRSLENIDSMLPNYLAELMVGYYTGTSTKIFKICNELWPNDGTENLLKVSKIKKFLSAISMGLRANQVWSGYPQDFGGLLLVKADGGVLFYYLYNLQKFENYLYGKLRFETPSASRHSFGQVYFHGDETRIKLNLQIRF